jgi:hypothetical protein
MTKMRKKRSPIPLPRGAKRITNKNGKRVWLYDGREFASRREMFQVLTAPKHLPLPEMEKGTSDVDQ